MAYQMAFHGALGRVWHEYGMGVTNVKPLSLVPRRKGMKGMKGSCDHKVGWEAYGVYLPEKGLTRS